MTAEAGPRDVLLLIDGHALVYRGFYALQNERPLTNARGELTTGAYGFVSMLLKAMERLRPRYVAAAFDVSAPTIRLADFAAYKGTRQAAPDGLKSQIQMSRRILDVMGIPMYDVPGYEADDAIGTLSRQGDEKGTDVIVLSGDNDLLQLVGPHVRIMTSRRGISDTVVYDVEGVREKIGLEPRQVPDFKALRGDTSDNIPGVPSIGDKTAQKLLSQFDTVENLLDSLASLPEKQRTLLEAHADQIRMAKRLATIECRLPLELDLRAAQIGVLKRPEVIGLFMDLGFRSLVDRLPSASAPPPVQSALFDDAEAPVEMPENADVVTTEEGLRELATALREAGRFSFNVQATGTLPMQADAVGIGLAAGERGAYVPFGHAQGEQIPRARALEILRPLFEDQTIAKRAHNAKFHMLLLARAGIEVQGLTFDTMIAAYLLESGQRALALRDLAWARLQVQIPSVASLLGTGKKALTMADVGISQCAGYACQEAQLVEALTDGLRAELDTAGHTQLFDEVELPLVPVLARMELTGIKVDLAYLTELGQELEQRLADLEAEIFANVGHELNVNSTQQLSHVLFEELHLQTRTRRSKTKTGHQSTGADVLEELRGTHPVVELILEHRQVQKLQSTYVDALRTLVNPETGRVHTSFNQTVAATGRLSSSDPNLQNIPIRTELGRRVRRAFVAEDGCTLFSADYSQIELRILAHMTHDPTLMEAFEAGDDPHAVTAAEVLNVPLAEVTADQRRHAKMVNYGVLYGMSDFGLAERTALPPAQASAFIQRYFERFGTVKQFQDDVIHSVERTGYATTLLGRRRYFPEIHSRIYGVRQAAVRAAINAPIQGTASDVVKVAMIHVDAYLRENAPTVRMLLQVHDELLLEGTPEDLERVSGPVVELMQAAMALDVPLHVDLKMGENWEDMRSIKSASLVPSASPRTCT